MQDNNPTQQRRLRGFAAMSPEKKREIAGMGGRAAHATGRAHQFTTEEARAAGKKRHQRDRQCQTGQLAQQLLRQFLPT